MSEKQTIGSVLSHAEGCSKLRGFAKRHTLVQEGLVKCLFLDSTFTQLLLGWGKIICSCEAPHGLESKCRIACQP